MIEGTVYHVEGRDELDGTESIVVTEISEIAYQKSKRQLYREKRSRRKWTLLRRRLRGGLRYE